MQIGGREFDVSHHTYVMGILNVTPDSFSDGGQHNTLEKALLHARRMAQEGADILDIGGESTRPGYQEVSEEEEMERVVEVIRRLHREIPIPLSIDTRKASVAAAAIEAGACMVNDIWGLKSDSRMAGVIAKTGASCCLMHNRVDGEYGDFMEDMMSDLRESLRLAKEAGIPEDKILIDPGIGFAKTYEQSLKALSSLRQIGQLGHPILLGASRKSVIGQTLNLPVEERLEGTLAVTAAAVFQGCAFVRVHDVKENVRVVRMAEAICGGMEARVGSPA